MKRLLLLYLLSLLSAFGAFAQFGDWNYSATVSINNTGNANTLTDYSVLVLVNTQTLIAEGKMNADGSDIRFTTNFSDNLSYWIEPGIQNERGINNASTYIWVKVPNIPGSGTTTIHMLYGNPSAAAETSIANTFLLGDDFDDNSLDASKWQVIIENSGVINEQNQRLEHNSPPTAQPYESSAYLFSIQQFTEPVVLEMQFKKGGYVYRSAGFNNEYPGFSNAANFGWQDYGLLAANTTVDAVTTNVTYPDTYWSTSYNPEYYLKIIRKEDGNFSYSAIVPAFEPGGPVVWENDISAVMPLATPLKVCAHDFVWQSASPTTRYEDNIRVRKYSSPEPVIELGPSQPYYPQESSWYKTIGGATEDLPGSIVFDGIGNFYLAGSFTGTVDFDPETGVDSKTSNGGTDIFLSKYSNTGSYIWTKTFGSTGDDLIADIYVRNMLSVDNSNNVYLASYFSGSVDFDPGEGSDIMSSLGGTDVCLIKINADGSYGWTKVFGGSNAETGQNCTIDNSGNIFVGGSIASSNVDFDPGEGQDLGSGTYQSPFIWKINSDGSYGWKKIFNINMWGYSQLNAIRFDNSQNLFAIGGFEYTMDFDPGAGTDNITSGGYTDIFLTKLNSDYSYSGTKTIGSGAGVNNQMALDFLINSSSSQYYTGSIQKYSGTGAVDMDPTSGTDLKSPVNGADFYLTKLTDENTYAWTKHWTGTGVSQGLSLATSGTGDYYVAGFFVGTMDFDPGDGVDSKTAIGSYDVFLMKFNADDTYAWTKTFGGAGSNTYNPCIRIYDNYIYLIGSFTGTIDLDPSAEVLEKTAAGGNDIFFVKLPLDNESSFSIPVISSFTPTSGEIGSTVVITGTNFNTTLTNNVVRFGAVQASVTSGSATELTVTVPVGATYQPITVTDITTGLMGYSNEPFNVTFPSSGTIDGTSFASAVDFISGTNTFYVSLTDIDGDGKLDMLSTNSGANSFSVFRNISSEGSIAAGSFDSKVDFSTGAAPFTATIGDIDGDGKQDLAIANMTDNTISIFRNTSSAGTIDAGSFAGMVDFTAGAGPRDIAIGDIDGDGKLDLAVANYYDNTVSVFRNTSTSGIISDGSFADKIDFITGNYPHYLSIGDIDGDDKPDIVVTNWGDGTISVFRNISAAGTIDATSFDVRADYTVGTEPHAISLVDIDGDSKLDIAVANAGSSNISLLRNSSTAGSITLETKVDLSTGTHPTYIASGNIDGDSKPDLVVANNTSNTVSVYQNTSTLGTIDAGSFATRVDFNTGTAPSYIAIGDIDGNGKPEIAVSNYSSNSVSVFQNTISDSNLIAYFPFNGNPNDESGNGNNGTEVNGVGLTTDRFGNADNAYIFDGADDYILVGDPIPSNLQIQNEITLSAWIYTSVFPSELGMIVGSQYDPTTSGASIMLDGRVNSDGQTNPSGHIHFQIGNGVWHVTNSNSVVPLNQWVLITAVRKANEDGKIYYNGQLQPSSSVAWDGSVTYNTSWFAIGQQKGSNRPFNGKIDDVRVYNRALTEEEIIALYEEGGFGHVTDIDGNVYRTVTIGNQVWMAKNLRTTHYSNGDAIGEVTDAGTWAALTTGAYCWYNNDYSTYGETYGALYNWFATSDSRNVCPTGWKVPSDEEWFTLENYVDPTIDDPNATGWRGTDGGTKLKATSGWNSGGNGINEYGFSALPGGIRNYNDGSFLDVGDYGYWWRNTESDVTNAWYMTMGSSYGSVSRNNYDKRNGFSVRCLKSTELPIEDFAGGNGTAEDPYQVANAAQLNNIRNYLGVENTDVYFSQIAPINLGESPWNEGEGWEPIGNATIQFYGNYNGNDYTITGLTINRPEESYIGLFGFTKEAYFGHISLIDVNIIGNQRVGALAGQLRENSIANSCYSTGNVSGQTFIGGIAGNLYYGSSLNSCYSSADIHFVTGTSPIQQAGGLVGRVHESCSINYCYASGNVGTADLGYWAGGLVGIISASSTVLNSYSTGNVSGLTNVGGFAGTVATASSVTNCYSVGKVISQEPGGGFIGTMDAEGVTISNSFWNIETSCQETSVAGNPKNTYQMIFLSAYPGWDFSSVWNIIQGSTYPYFLWQGSPGAHNYPSAYLNPSNLTATPGNGSISLQWRTPSMGNVTEYNIYRNGSFIASTTATSFTDNGLTNYTTYSYYVTAVYTGNESESSNTVSMFPHAGFSGGDGSEANPYIISNAGELHTTRLYLSSHFQQVADIDLGVDPWNSGEGWNPIGVSFNYPFSGNYNGNGFTISNLTINKPNSEVIGLFGSSNGATFRNINLVNANVIGMNYVGPLAGDVNYSAISNVNTSGYTYGTSIVGGIAGGIFHFTSLDKCFSTGSVNSSGDLAGGITGLNHNESSISESYSNATITSTGNFVGGISGHNQIKSITANSYFRGSVSGNSFVGGVTGYLDSSIVHNCYSTGYVTGTESVGGLIGIQAHSSSVNASYWNTETSGQISSAGGEGRYTYQMTSPYEEFTYYEWNFNDIWGEDFDYDINNGYPYLRMQLPDPPSVATGVINYTTPYSAKVSGQVFNDNGYTVTSRGIIWDTDADLELEFENYLGIVEAGEGLGSFDAILQPLTPGTEYYARAFAISEAGYGYGDVVSFGTLNETDLCIAVDNCAHSYQSGGDAVWYAQNIYTFDEMDAVQSGYILDNQSTWFETTLTGPGNVSYRWRVSSQQDADYLRLYRNGTAYYVITGTTEGWQYVVFDIPEGETTLRWEYFKDESGSDGFDCGWVDQFTFIQTGIPSVTSCGASNLTSSSASLCGNVTSEGYYSVTDRGVIWGYSPDISIDFNEGLIYEGGTGLGSFDVPVSSLTPETQYYYRAFALNTIGAGYGEAIGFTTKAESITFFVNQMTGNDGNDGKSWSAAFATLQRALDEPIPENVEKMEIWVAAGDYKPSSTHGLSTEIQYRHFRMRNNVEIYGGFAGTETTIDQRNISANITYLSGDNYSDDWYGGMWYNRTDNCYHVFYHPDIYINSSAVLDGFTIRFGNAVGDGNFNKGGGMFNYYSHPTLRNVIFTHNNASYGGGALYNEGSESVISDSRFISNTTQSGVGGAAVLNSSSYETYVNVVFDQNISGSYGGAVSLFNGSSPVYINSLFTNNQGPTIGGAFYVEESSPAIINSTFYNNSYIAIANFSGSLHLTNCIIWGNTGGSIYNDDPIAVTITYSNIQYGYEGEGNLDVDPQFADVSSDNFRLTGTSPCMDTGVNWPFEPDQIADGITYDLDGNPRIVNSYIDMGCYEYQGSPPELPILTTTAVTGITVNSATSGGNISSDNGYAVTQRGVVWSDSQIPTIAAYSGITNNGTGTGSFTSSLTGLTAGTSYKVRAYAINEKGVGYGQLEEFSTQLVSFSGISATPDYYSATISLTLQNAYDLYYTVRYGKQPNLSDAVSTNPAYISSNYFTTQAVLSSLDENTVYYYQIQVETNDGPNYSGIFNFRTLCSYTITTSIPSGSNNVCAGSQHTYTTISTNAESYQWNLNPSNSGTITPYGNSAVVQWSQSFSGNAYVQVSGISGTCNSQMSQLQVEVILNTSNITIAGETEVCRESNVLYTLSSQADDYLWILEEGGTIVSSSSTNAMVHWTSTGTYSLQLFEQASTGCPSHTYLNVDVNNFNAPQAPQIHRKGSINILICTTPEMDYKWFFNGGTISAQTKQFYVARNNLGDYNVQVTDNANCPNTSDKYNLNTLATELSMLQVYPNPTFGEFTLDIETETFGSASLLISDTFGKVLHREVFNKYDYLVSRSYSNLNLPKGFYIVTVTIGNELPLNTKLTIY